MKNFLQRMFLSVIVAGIFHFTAAAQAYDWKPVRIGGGGRVTSIKPHPKVANLFFITTDVGTSYRWNHATQRWEEMMLGTKIPTTYWNWQNNQLCGDLAFDPNDATGNILYATVSNGKGTVPGGGSDQRGTVMKSTDRGNTWTDCGLQILVAPNSDQIFTDRLVVDPQNSNVIYVTTRSHGTHRSVSAGTPGSWVKLTTPFDALSARFIKFDISGGTVNGVTKNIFIGTVNGIYRSADGGVNFSLMSGGPIDVRRASISNDGTLYVTTTPTPTNGAIQQWKGSYWSTISPDATKKYKAIAVNPINSNEVLTATEGSWNNDKLYRTTTGGAAGGWTAMNVTRDNTEAPHSLGGSVSAGNAGHDIDMFCFDPFNAGHAWFSDMTDVAQTTDVWAATVNWKLRDAGLEEVIATGQLVCPPSGRNVLLSTTGDVGGFDHQSLIDPPQKGMASFFSTSSGINTSGVAVQYTNPNFIARVGSDGWNGSAKGGYSEDGGLSYRSYATLPPGAVRGRVAVSATSSTIVWVSQGGFTYTSSDKGNSWTASSGVPKDVLKTGSIYSIYPGQTPVSADKVSGNIFYIYAKGVMYVSYDTGRTFSAKANNLPNDQGNASFACIATTPGISGDVWFSHENGLYHSVDTAKTFTRINASVVGSPKWVAVGKADTSTSSPPVVYITSGPSPVNGTSYGVFRSDDNGNNWTTVTENVPGIVLNMAADIQGRVFLGINGNGIFVGVPVGGPVTGVTITPASSSVILNDSLKLKATLSPVYPNNNTISWSSSDISIVSVDANGLVKGRGVGTATVTVTTQDGGLTASSTITVTPIIHVTGVTLDSDVYIGLGGSTNLVATVLPADAKNKNVSWSSSDTTIVKVNASGLISAIGLGNAVVTVTTEDSRRTASSVIHVTTTALAYNVGDISNSYGNFRRDPNSWSWTWATKATTAINMSAVSNPAPEAVYQSQRNGITSSTPYFFTGLIPNSLYTLRLHFAELNTAAVSGSKRFDVIVNNTETVLKSFDIYAAAGGRFKAIVREFPVTASATGGVSVKFSIITGTSSINGMELVLKPLSGVALDRDSAFVGVGDTTRLTALMAPADVTNKGVSWKSSNPNVALVSANGLVRGMGPGTAIITITTNEGSKTDSAVITAANILATGVTIDSVTAIVGVNNTNKLTATVSPANATNKAVVWSSSDTTIVKVNGTGVITGLAPGTATITVTTQDGAKTASSIVTASNILLNSITLSKAAVSLGVDDTTTIRTKVLPSNASNPALTWSSSDTTIAKVNATGFITARSVGTATITATAVDDGQEASSLALKVVSAGSCGLLSNNGFESGFVNWAKASANASMITDSLPFVHSGMKAVIITAQSNSGLNYKPVIPINAGVEITFSAWAKIAGSPNPGNPSQLLMPWWTGIGIDYYDSAGVKINGESNQFQVYPVTAPAVVPSSYTKYSVTRVPPPNTASVGIWASKSGPGYFYLDDFCITVKDTQAPVVPTLATVTGECSASVSVPTTTDNIAGIITGTTTDPLTYSAQGTYLITWNFNDGNGNMVTATQNVIIKDTTAAIVLTKDITVELDSAGNASITEELINNGSFDACGIQSIVLSKKNFDCSNVGANAVILTVTDVNGNVASTNANVTVQDNIAPVALAKNIPVTLIDGSAIITASSIDDGSFDACGIQSLTINKSTFDCSNIGNNTVVLTVTDINGNVSTASAIVNVIGFTPAPVITVTKTDNTYTKLDNQTIAIGYGAQNVTLTATNNIAGTTSYAWSPSAGLSNATVANPVFTPTAAGSYTFIVTATNEFGCSANTSVTITVIDVRSGNNNDKVLVCTKDGTKTLSVSDNSVDTHLRNGDQLGSCGSSETAALSTTTLANGIQGADPKNISISLQKVALTAYPNPFKKQITIAFTIPSTQDKVALDVHSLLGNKIQKLFEGKANGGQTYTFEFDGTFLSPGIYFIRLTTPQSVENFKIIMTK
ncbi:MAG: Por secretion system C-terminal sorting protein [Sphingobacteriales bacterium]|nr:Por secretion system C-terminal sorting protein [Sphingobacteriales bacterium]